MGGSLVLAVLLAALTTFSSHSSTAQATVAG